MVVDDSRMSRMILQKFIEAAQPEWRVEEAANGEEALSKANEQVFQLITVDYNMPGMNGIELAEKLRSRFPKAKIVLVTANVQEATQQKASVLGLDFIAKPLTERKIEDYVCQ